MNVDNLSTNSQFVNMIRDMAAELGATTVLVGEKTYRFSLTNNKNLDIPKEDIQMAFLRECNPVQIH